jgi:acyl-coenzyme A synthetase/AMP-(fatty) acid ligase
MDYVASKVVQHKRLRGGVRFIDVVPKSASGKLLRRVIKDWVKEEEKIAKIDSKL